METTIAIIGATGNMGSTLAFKLSKAGYRLLLNGRNQEKLQKLSEDIRSLYPGANLEIVNCNIEAAHEADIIILCVKYQDEREIAQKITVVAQNKIVISIANPFNQAFERLITELDSSAAEELARQLPRSKVVKAFNTISAEAFENPIMTENSDCFIAGDDEGSVNMVASLVSNMGFHSIVAGELKMSRILENMMLMITNINRRNPKQLAIGYKILHK